MSNQRTLDQHFKMPPMKPRQFQAVTVKNWTLLAQSPFGMIGCFIVSVLFVVLVGWLHTFYEHQYKPIDNNSSEMIPNPMPIESQPENINHHMHFTLTTNVSADTIKFFGNLPENAQGTGFIGAADRKWTANNEKAQLRAQYAIPENINCSITQSQIPFATIDDLSCTTDACKPKYTTFEQLDEAVNNTLYELMAQDIDAEHKQPTKKLSFTEKLLNAVENSFKVKKVQETEFTFTINDYNLTNQFKWDKHERLYTSAVNFSYLNFPINKLLAPKVHEVGYKYILSSYSSHQTQMSYSLSNFNHLGGTQYFLYQTFLRNTFEPQVGSEPASVKGYQKQFWELYQDQGADPFTPIFSTVLIPIAFYLLVTLFAYQMSQEKGDGLLSLQQMMGLRYYPRYLADLVYQLVIGLVMFGVIMGGCAISGMEFISHTYWGIWFLFGMLFVLNIPLLSQLLSSFTDSGRISSILSIFIILVEAVVGISWVSNMYDASVVDRTISMWYALIPGMAPIVAMAMVNGLIITQNPNNYLSESLYFKLSKVSDGSMTADVGYEVAWAIMLGFIALVVYAFLSIYIDRITPRRNGIPEHPLFFLQSLYERASVNARRIFVEITWASAFWAVGQMFVHPRILLILWCGLFLFCFGCFVFVFFFGFFFFFWGGLGVVVWVVGLCCLCLFFFCLVGWFWLCVCVVLVVLGVVVVLLWFCLVCLVVCFVVCWFGFVCVCCLGFCCVVVVGWCVGGGFLVFGVLCVCVVVGFWFWWVCFVFVWFFLFGWWFCVCFLFGFLLVFFFVVGFWCLFWVGVGCVFLLFGWVWGFWLVYSQFYTSSFEIVSIF
ncbi:ABC_transporter family protein [Hexamita inflata]|uniref:ABC transporter family protein n=1 Tax=Hexamita inflata TaxID=28002 RepID=A0AA86NP32_9EUKA|nr:ABC transporter family protein [Hexamita inflata]